ncbi:hypothetical protein H5410_027762 [Solanum commersonii]|uniref:Uncharacterized protein n=1 Tax=Solanum commersonii TaxID=4109 RepID=A0A9J5Z5F6_SOLCO|nr:hypothetical protein H5410_027762 [Solanum commersonii]
MDDWDKSWLDDEDSYINTCNFCSRHHLDIECPICHMFGHQYISLGYEGEKEKQEAHNVNSLMECTDMLDKVNSKIIEQILECGEEKSKIMKLLDHLDASQREITVQAKLEEIEYQQGESYGETEILSQSWLQEQT